MQFLERPHGGAPTQRSGPRARGGPSGRCLPSGGGRGGRGGTGPRCCSPASGRRGTGREGVDRPAQARVACGIHRPGGLGWAGGPHRPLSTDGAARVWRSAGAGACHAGRVRDRPAAPLSSPGGGPGSGGGRLAGRSRVSPDRAAWAGRARRGEVPRGWPGCRPPAAPTLTVALLS